MSYTMSYPFRYPFRFSYPFIRYLMQPKKLFIMLVAEKQ